MAKNGFLILTCNFLTNKFKNDPILKEKKWLISNAGPKLIVHGPKRDLLGDTDVIAEITSSPKRKWIAVELMPNGTVPDQALLIEVVSRWATKATMLTTKPKEE